MNENLIIGQLFNIQHDHIIKMNYYLFGDDILGSVDFTESKAVSPTCNVPKGLSSTCSGTISIQALAANNVSFSCCSIGSSSNSFDQPSNFFIRPTLKIIKPSQNGLSRWSETLPVIINV